MRPERAARIGKLVKVQRAQDGPQPRYRQAIKINAKTTLKFRLAKSAKDAVFHLRPNGVIGRKPLI